MQIAQRFAGQSGQQGHINFARAQLGEHFAGREVVQGHAHAGEFVLEGAQSLRQNLDRQGRGVTHLNFPAQPARHRLGRLHRLRHALQNRAGLRQKHPARLREPHGLGVALEEREAQFVFEIADWALDWQHERTGAFFPISPRRGRPLRPPPGSGRPVDPAAAGSG